MSDGGAQFWTDQFIDNDGSPYSGVKIYHYVAGGTTTNKTVWTDEAKTTPAAQPVVGNAAGRVSFYGDGDYRLLIKDSGDNTLFDWDYVKITSDTATMWEGNFGTSYPSAAAANRWHEFLKVDGSNNPLELGFNSGSEFVPLARPKTKGADIASGATLTIGKDGDYFDVTGTTTITAFSSVGAGSRVWLHFDGSLTLTHDATALILPWGANIQTFAGMELAFEEYSTGNWRCISFLGQHIITKGSDVAAGATLTLVPPGNYFDITGTTTITAIATYSPGSIVYLQFDGALTVTHQATDLILPGGANITTIAGTRLTMFEYQSAKWICINVEYGYSSKLASQLTMNTDAPATPTTNTLYRDLIPKAWVDFDGVTAGAPIANDVGVSSITDIGTGNFTISLSNAFANAYFIWVGGVGQHQTAIRGITEAVTPARSTSSVTIYIRDGADTVQDQDHVMLAFFGDQT